MIVFICILEEYSTLAIKKDYNIRLHLSLIHYVMLLQTHNFLNVEFEA